MLFALFDAELGGKLRKKSICYKMIKVFQLGMILISLLIAGCKKDEAQIFTDNDAPYYDKVPSVKVRNYVNRLFIDLLGREPLDAKM